MKLCFLGDAGCIHTQRWVNYFNRPGYQVHLISTRAWSGPAVNPEVKIHLLTDLPRLPFVSYRVSCQVNLFLFAWQVRRLVARIKPDILHAHYLADYGFWGATSGFHPLVATAWGSDVLITPRESWFNRWLVSLVLKKSDRLTCDGENLVRTMIDLGAKPEKIELVYFGVDLDEFSRRRQPTRPDPVGRLTVFSFRNLYPLYDLATLIRAVPLVLRQTPEVRFVIGGDGPERAHLVQLAGQLGVAKEVEFIGRIDHAELPGRLASADIYVSTSKSDGGVSVSALEAMASELPLILTDIGDNRQWIQDGVNGYLFPVGNEQVLAARIIDLSTDQAKRSRFAQANRRLVAERADFEKEMAKIERLYQNLLSK